MEHATNVDTQPRGARALHSEEIEDEMLEESHAAPLRKLLLERESATERFRAFKRRLLGER